MLYSLIAWQAAQAAHCTWESAQFHWTADAELTASTGEVLITLLPGRYDRVMVEQGKAGPAWLLAQEGPLRVSGLVELRTGLHPIAELPIGGGITLGPWATVGVAEARRGKVELRPAPLMGVRPYVPDVLPTPRVDCAALGLAMPPLPEDAGGGGDAQLAPDRAVEVLARPGGRRLGEYPAEPDSSSAFEIWPEGDERVSVVERRDGYAHIIDDRASWRLDAWVREEDLTEPTGEGFGGLGARGTGLGGTPQCVRPTELYVVDGQGGAWHVGQIDGAEVYAGVKPDPSGYLSITVLGVGNILPGGGRGWSFAVGPDAVGDCPR